MIATNIGGRLDSCVPGFLKDDSDRILIREVPIFVTITLSRRNESVTVSAIKTSIIDDDGNTDSCNTFCDRCHGTQTPLGCAISCEFNNAFVELFFSNKTGGPQTGESEMWMAEKKVSLCFTMDANDYKQYFFAEIKKNCLSFDNKALEEYRKVDFDIIVISRGEGRGDLNI